MRMQHTPLDNADNIAYNNNTKLLEYIQVRSRED